MTAKQQMLDAIGSLPDDVGFQEAIQRLYVLYKVQRGIEQADAGQKVSDEEAMQRISRWLS